MTDDLRADATNIDLENLCTFLERHQGSISIDRIVGEGFVGTKVTIRVQPPHRKPAIHEALRPDAKISGRVLPTFANEIEEMVRHLKLAYPDLADKRNGDRSR